MFYVKLCLDIFGCDVLTIMVHASVCFAKHIDTGIE